jgi:hypothetical protein
VEGDEDATARLEDAVELREERQRRHGVRHALVREDGIEVAVPKRKRVARTVVVCRRERELESGDADVLEARASFAARRERLLAVVQLRRPQPTHPISHVL